MQQNIPRHSTKEESSKRYIRKLAKCLSFCKFSVFYLVVSLNCCKFAALNYPYKIIYYMNRTIITVVGKDTKGIIARVCTYLAEKDVNILDISQTIVQEYFNMMKENENIWIESSLYSPLMVKDAVDMALDVLAGKDVEPVKIISTTVVDRDNVDEYLDPENTVY